MSEIITKPKNKGGRPPGTGERQRIWDTYVKPHTAEMIKLGLEEARGGEPSLIKFFLDRMIPKNPLTNLLDLSGTPKQQMEKLLMYFASGDLSSDDAVKAASLVKESVALTEIKMIADRMTMLENWIMQRKDGVTFNGEAKHKPDGETARISVENEDTEA